MSEERRCGTCSCAGQWLDKAQRYLCRNTILSDVQRVLNSVAHGENCPQYRPATTGDERTGE